MTFYLSGGFTPPPSGPLTVTPFPDAVPPYVQIELTVPTTAATTATIQRQNPDGRWQPVRGAEPATLAAGGHWAGQDFEAPFGARLRYRALGLETVQTSVTAVDVGGGVLQLADTVILDVADPWLIHPGVPARSQKLLVAETGDVTAAARRAVFQVIGSPRPVVLSQARTAQQSSLTVRTETSRARAALEALLADGSVLLLNVPVTLGWDIPTDWISIGDWTAARFLQYGPEPSRSWTLPYDLTDRPQGDLQALWSYAALRAENPTEQQLEANYANYGDMSAHRPS